MWMAVGTFLFDKFLVPVAASFLPKLIDLAQKWIYSMLERMKKEQADEEYKKVSDAIERGDTREANRLIRSPNADRPSGRPGMRVESGEGQS